MMISTEELKAKDPDIRENLRNVVDPEIGLNVIELGLIKEIELIDGQTNVKMLLTTPFCPYAPAMLAEVKQATEEVVGPPVKVELLPDRWDPSMMEDPSILEGYLPY